MIAMAVKAKRTKTTKQRRRPKSAGARKVIKPLLNAIPKQLDHARRVKSSAQSTGVSESQLRRLIRTYKLAKWDRKTRRWRITDRARREVGIISNGSAKAIIVRGFAKAQLAKSYSAAVKRFLETNDVAVLAPFQGQLITDINKQNHPLETRPNVLLRLANAGGDAEMKIYRLID
jgi:transcriptional regulator GlxA family with amidase domain